jgi:hypothetical protein
MDDQTFQDKFSELMGRIRDLPDDQRTRMEKLAEDTRHRRDRIQRSVNELQESLDYLRLSVKYLVFDLEATRRENSYLRRLIEQSNRDDNTQGNDDVGPNDNFLEGEDFS